MTSKIIKTLRTAAGLTQQELANVLELDRSSVGKYESGTHPSPEVMLKISAFFNVSVDYLYGLQASDPLCAKDEAEAKLLTMFRKTDGIPLEKRAEIADYIGATIDMYLKALGSVPGDR
ncbi:MAG: helix-turn-helix transcriptional regulator [Clostridiales bacterium]|nr:helix-turn-helix transcriptional regulator [Clostridiales bacterium]